MVPLPVKLNSKTDTGTQKDRNGANKEGGGSDGLKTETGHDTDNGRRKAGLGAKGGSKDQVRREKRKKRDVEIRAR